MNDGIRAALEIDRATPMEQRTIDITTTGRRSGEPRRIETVFHRVGDLLYLSGLPSERPRAWLLNLEAEPRLVFHLKHGVQADLPATATIITDPTERRRVLAPVVAEFNAGREPDSGQDEAVLDEWVTGSPLARVSFDEAG